MKWLVIFLMMCGVAGCASRSGQSLDPERARKLAMVRTELAATYYEQMQYKAALEELAKAVRADSAYATAYDVRGLVHMALLEDSEAESDFRQSLSLDPNSSETHNNYGWFLCQRGHEREAVKHFLIAAKDPLYETPWKAYTNAGVCSKKAGQTQDASLYLQRALLLQPELPEALVEMADLGFVTGDYASAKSYFARFEKATTAPLTAENLFLAVRIEHRLGNRSAESAYAERLNKNFPDSRESKMLGQVR